MALPDLRRCLLWLQSQRAAPDRRSRRRGLRNRLGSVSLVRAVGDILQGPDDRFQGIHTAHDEQADEWTLQSGFDGDALLSRPGIELVPVDADVIRRAEKLIDGCEYCHADDADVPFDWILDKITGRYMIFPFLRNLTNAGTIPELGLYRRLPKHQLQSQ